jgi:hypothetical protein
MEPWRGAVRLRVIRLTRPREVRQRRVVEGGSSAGERSATGYASDRQPRERAVAMKNSNLRTYARDVKLKVRKSSCLTSRRLSSVRKKSAG